MSEIQRTTLCYLGTPYSKYPMGLHAAFQDAARLTANLMRLGIGVYSPIVHMHPVAIEGGLDPLDYTIWLPANQAMMDVCPVLIVAHLDSWDTSIGLAHEVKFYESARRPIYDLNPETMTLARRRTAVELAHDKTPSLHAGSSA